MKWFYNSNTGAVQQFLAATFFELHLGTGWHGPFDTKEEALQFYADNAPNNPGWVAPTGFVQQLKNLPNSLGKVAGNAGNTVLSGVAANVWPAIQRGLEIALGIVLLAIAANAIIKQTTGMNPGRAAAHGAKRVGKAAATAAVVA